MDFGDCRWCIFDPQPCQGRSSTSDQTPGFHRGESGEVEDPSTDLRICMLLSFNGKPQSMGKLIHLTWKVDHLHSEVDASHIK